MCGRDAALRSTRTLAVANARGYDDRRLACTPRGFNDRPLTGSLRCLSRGIRAAECRPGASILAGHSKHRPVAAPYWRARFDVDSTLCCIWGKFHLLCCPGGVASAMGRSQSWCRGLCDARGDHSPVRIVLLGRQVNGATANNALERRERNKVVSFNSQRRVAQRGR